jgi:hypothetical protein
MLTILHVLYWWMHHPSSFLFYYEKEALTDCHSQIDKRTKFSSRLTHILKNGGEN